ncbi:MAG: PD40 domain-containing protein, partial [Bacteroidales bacterium]|nr:PD40 domain-containing protein [Bacteroidales bacterium]
MKTTGFAIAAATLMMIMGCSQKKAENSTAFIGPSDIQVVEGAMTPETLLSFGRLSDPQLSPDGKWILYGVSYTSIDENRSCRNLFLQEVGRNEDGNLVFGDKIQLTSEGKSVGNARWSLDGGHIFFTQGGQIWKAAFKGEGGKPALGEKVKLSDVEGGVGEFLLSPDQTQVLYTSTVPGAVKTPKDFDPSLDKAKAYVTEDLAYRHWDHWTTERPQTYVAPLVEGVEITKDKSLNILDSGANKYELPIEPFSGIEQLCWSPDGQMVAYSCKKVDTGREYAFSTDTEIYIYKIITGETVRIEMDGGYDTDPVWSPDGKHIAWISMARNGYEADKTRLMVADLAAEEKGGDGQTAIPGILGVRELTADFKYNAEGPVWSADSKIIYFASLTEGLKAIYKVDAVAGAFSEEGNRLDIAVIPVRITPDDAWYDFNSPFSVVDGTLLASYASMEFPTELVAVKEGDGSFSRISDENGHILGQLDPCNIEERWITTVDGKKMLTWVLYPPKFDSTKVYPAVEIFLGGPQGTLSQGWSYRW